MDDTLAQPFRDRGAEEIRVDALSLVDARTVLLWHLHRYRKVLEPRQVDALLSKADATSPLYLACVAEELRTLGVREELDKHIAAMPPDVGGLFLWVLRRLETDRQFRWDDGATKVRLLLSCLGVSRDGLSESELSGLVDDASGDVAVLLRLLRPYLSRRGDLLSLHHRAHGEALRGIGIGDESRRLLGDEHPGYLDEESEVDAAREVLATYFDGTESNVVSERQAYEWPHQLFHLNAWERLEACLLQRAVFERLAVDATKWELTSYWHPLREAPLSRDMGALYVDTFEQWRTGDELEHTEEASTVGIYLAENGCYESSEKLLRLSLLLRSKLVETNHLPFHAALNNLAILLRNMAKFQESESLYRRLLGLQTSQLGESHVDTLKTLYNLSIVMVDLEDYTTAETYRRKAFAGYLEAYGENHPFTVAALNSLATITMKRGDLDEAESMYIRAIDLLVKSQGADSPSLSGYKFNLANCLLAKGQSEQAGALHTDVLAGRRQILGPTHRDTLESMRYVAMFCLTQGNIERAESLWREVLTTSECSLGPDHPDTLTSVHSLGVVLKARGHLNAAIKLFKRAYIGRQMVLGPTHAKTKHAGNALKSLIETVDLVKQISGRVACEVCNGTGYMNVYDLERLGLRGDKFPGICYKCNDTMRD
jgi:tetratricopeptide (TPR) repeat protein